MVQLGMVVQIKSATVQDERIEMKNPFEINRMPKSGLHTC